MTPKSQQQTLSQERAAGAWECVSEIKKDDRKPEFKSRYSALIRKCPSLILTVGLGQTLAFLKAKSSGKETASTMAASRAYEHLQQWLAKRMGFGEDVIDWITKTDSSNYRRAGAEALAFLTWLKPFAESVLPKDDDDLGSET